MKTQQQYDNIFDNLKLSSKFKKDINEYNLEDVIQLIDIGINESDDDFIFKVIKNYNDFSDKLKNLFMRIIHRRPYVKYVNLFLKYTDIDFSDGNYIIPRKIATYGYLNIFKRLMKEKNLVNEESLELYFSESCMEQYHIVKYLIDEFEFEINAKYNIFFALNCISRKKKMIKIFEESSYHRFYYNYDFNYKSEDSKHFIRQFCKYKDHREIFFNILLEHDHIKKYIGEDFINELKIQTTAEKVNNF